MAIKLKNKDKIKRIDKIKKKYQNNKEAINKRKDELIEGKEPPDYSVKQLKFSGILVLIFLILVVLLNLLGYLSGGVNR